MSCSSRWRTKRILLRRFVNADAAPLAEVIFAEADVMKTLIGDASTPERQLALAQEWIARWNECWDEHGYGVWAVEIADPSLGEPGTLIGFSGFEAPVLPGEGPELIAGRGSAWWSQGISTELGHAVIDHLFAHTDSGALHALVFSEINPAAVRMMEKLGLAAAGEVPIHARVGPLYQNDSLRFERARVLLARPGSEAPTLDLAAFKTGQLLGCRAADGVSLLAEALAAGPAGPVRAGFEEGLAQPLPGEDYRALGTAWLDRAVERRLQRIAATRDDAVAREAALELGRISGAVARDLADALEILCEHAARRGLHGVRERVAERLRAGLAHPTMRLFRLHRSERDGAPARDAAPIAGSEHADS